MPQEIGSLGQIEAGGYAFRNLVTVSFDVTPEGTWFPDLTVDMNDPLGRIQGIVFRENVFFATPSKKHTYDQAYLGETHTVKIIAKGNFDRVTDLVLIGRVHPDTVDLSPMPDLNFLEMNGWLSGTVPSGWLPSGMREVFQHDSGGGSAKFPETPFSRFPASMQTLRGKRWNTALNGTPQGWDDMAFEPQVINFYGSGVDPNDILEASQIDTNTVDTIVYDQPGAVDLDVLRGSNIKAIGSSTLGDRREFVKNTNIVTAGSVKGDVNQDLSGTDGNGNPIMPSTLETWKMIGYAGDTFTDFSNAGALTYLRFVGARANGPLNANAMAQGMIDADASNAGVLSQLDVEVSQRESAYPGYFPITYKKFEAVKPVVNTFDLSNNRRTNPVRVKEVVHQSSADDYYLCDDPNFDLERDRTYTRAFGLNCGDGANNIVFNIDSGSLDHDSGTGETKVYTSVDGETLTDVDPASLDDTATMYFEEL